MAAKMAAISQKTSILNIETRMSSDTTFLWLFTWFVLRITVHFESLGPP